MITLKTIKNSPWLGVALLVIFDIYFCWDVPSFKVLFLLLCFQVPALMAGWNLGEWRMLHTLCKEVDRLQELAEKSEA